jgi:hypothetical protein
VEKAEGVSDEAAFVAAEGGWGRLESIEGIELDDAIADGGETLAIGSDLVSFFNMPRKDWS